MGLAEGGHVAILVTAIASLVLIETMWLAVKAATQLHFQLPFLMGPHSLATFDPNFPEVQIS
jgi:hypothetical protein